MMTKGFKDSDGKFHPIKNYKKLRKSRNITIPDGIKLINKTKRHSPEIQTMMNGISKSIENEPIVVQKKIKTIIIKERDPCDCFKAITDPSTGQVTFNVKPEQTEDEYEVTGAHEYEHIWFKGELDKKNPKMGNFILKGNEIPPFTPDLLQVMEETEQAFIDNNFGVIPEKIMEYPDEINSVVKEVETRKRLGLPTNVFDEDTYQKAKKMVDDLHRKKMN